jgi:hypothetical protein
VLDIPLFSAAAPTRLALVVPRTWPGVAPQGKDGGLDIIAYRDPLGMASPRTKWTGTP